jgi:uncharacterized protein
MTESGIGFTAPVLTATAMSPTLGETKLITLADPLLSTLSQGGILLIDDLDAHFHPLISQKIVAFFKNHGTNPRWAQLVFSTNDEGLMDKSLSVDEINLTWRGRDGAKISGLCEYSDVRKVGNALVYLRGIYGGVPSLVETDDVVKGLVSAWGWQ